MINRKVLLLLIIFIAPLAGMGIDIYSPALPSMQRALGVTSFLGGLTMTAYLMGYAIGLAFMGPLSDSLGRIKILSFGLNGFIVICVLLMFSTSIHMLLILRFLQGIFVAGPGVMYKVLISDLFDEKTIPKISSNASIAWALGPVVAPFIGGFLAHHFHWQACFAFLAFYAIILLILISRYLHESNPNFIPLKIQTIVGNYARVLSHKTFLALIIALSISYSVFVLFNVNGPFLIQNGLGYNAIVYGSSALILGLSYFAGVVMNRLLICRYNTIRISYVGVGGFGLGSVILLLTGLFGMVKLAPILLCLMLCFFFNGFILTNTLARCILIFRDKAGTANAVMNASFVLGSAILSIVGSQLSYLNQTSLAISYVVMSLLLALILYICGKA